MSDLPKCPHCGQANLNSGRVWLWFLGAFSISAVGCLLLLVVCLSAVVLIGDSAQSEFSQLDRRIEEGGVGVSGLSEGGAPGH